MRILLVEDEQTLAEQTQKQLEQMNYVVDLAPDGQEGLYCGREYPIDVAIIDLGLPKLSGLDLIRTLRKEDYNFPILILTARNRWQEKVEGLEAGADDYLIKPFHMEELAARLRALVRRSTGWTQSILQVGPIALDTQTQEITVDNKVIKFTNYEYRLLEYLMLHKGKVLSKTALTEHIYAEDADRDSNVIEVFIRRVRQKIDPDNTLQPIETLRGRGYRLKDL